MTTESMIVNKAMALIDRASADVDERHLCVVEFEKLVLQCPEPDAAAILRDLSPLLPRLNQIYEAFETDLEFGFARKLLSDGLNVEHYYLYQRFSTLISNEVKMSGLNRGDTPVMIGSGPFPISAILLFANFGIKVIAVERNHDSAALSREVVKRLSLDGGISVEAGDGRHTATQDISCALVALLAQPKGAILDNIFRKSEDASVICRTSHGLRQALYCPADPQLLASYNIRATQLAVGDQTISSVLLGR